MLNVNRLKKLVRTIVVTRHDECNCEICFQELDRFVEMTLAGKDASEAMPLVQSHLQICTDCGEEFRALLDALNALEKEDASDSS